jgi:FtsH-binding integral membrane protein
MYYAGLGKDDLEYARYWSALGLYLNIVNLFNFFVSLGRD